MGGRKEGCADCGAVGTFTDFIYLEGKLELSPSPTSFPGMRKEGDRHAIRQGWGEETLKSTDTNPKGRGGRPSTRTAPAPATHPVSRKAGESLVFLRSHRIYKPWAPSASLGC